MADTNIITTPVLDLRNLLHSPEGKICVAFDLDLSHLDFFGDKPIQSPVQVEASVTNHAGALHLQGKGSSLLHLHCDRCGCALKKEKVVLLDNLVADSLEDEEHDEIILLNGTMLDLAEVATTAFILEMDTKTLCDEACKGICHQCGTDLNTNPCSCPGGNDSPFALLASLLDD